MKPNIDSRPSVIIKPPRGWETIDIKELRAYQDLFFFLVWRDIKVLYAQTILGFSWAILNPLIQIIIFSIIFGQVAQLPTDGIPYVLFSTVAIIPWTYMSESMNASSQSLVSGQAMLGKVYFPRIIFPVFSCIFFQDFSRVFFRDFFPGFFFRDFSGIFFQDFFLGFPVFLSRIFFRDFFRDFLKDLFQGYFRVIIFQVFFRILFFGFFP